jgi:ActR/RegA family two-component response regulator
MRVLIADRNARLLESISRTFAPQFSIQTASTRKHCGDLLRQGEFDLAVISEKLADGPGLQLIGQIARSSPDTLRIFAARRSRLQLLKGKLGPFGLFRTLAYPIEAQKLLSALTLARAGLGIDMTALNRHVVIEERQAGEVPAAFEKAAIPLRAPHSVAVTPGPAAVRPTVKRVSPAFTHPALSINVPMTIASMRRNRPSESSSAPQPAPLARQVPGIPSGVRSVRAQAQSALPQPVVARSAASPRLPSQSEAFRRASAKGETAESAASSQIVSRSARRGRQFAAASGGRPRPLTQTPPLGSPAEFVRRATAVHPTHKPQLAQAAAKRTMVPLAAAIAVVFLVATLTLRLFDASAAPSSSAQATRTSRVGSFSAPRQEIEQRDTSAPRQEIEQRDTSAPRQEIEQRDTSAPPRNLTPAGPTPWVHPAQSVAQRAEPKADSTTPDEVAPHAQMAASSTPIADPSTFGSEAYESIYSN